MNPLTHQNEKKDSTYKTVTEYTDAVRSWMQQYCWWNQCNYFASCQLYAMNISAFQHAQLINNLSSTASSSQFSAGARQPTNSAPASPASSVNNTYAPQRQPVITGSVCLVIKQICDGYFQFSL